MERFPKDMKKAFQELVKNDPELLQRIRKRLKSAWEKRQEKHKEGLFGYDLKDGVLAVNREESKVVKWIYERYLSYSENPPAELVEAALKRAKEYETPVKNISIEEAKNLVSGTQVKEYIAHELSLKEFYYHVLCETEPSIQLEDVLSLSMEEMPKDKLEKLMADISELERMRKAQEYSGRIKRVLSEDFYSGVTKFRSSPATRKGAKPLEDQFIVVKDHEAIISLEMFRAAQEKQSRLKK